MALIDDASASPSKALTSSFSKDRIVREILNEIVKDLEIEDVISIIFLFTHTGTNVSEIIKLLNKDSIAVFLKLYKETEWAEKLLEVLLITGNRNIIMKLGYRKVEIDAMEKYFVVSIHNVSPHLNKVIKSLYFLCKELRNKEASKLIQKVNEAVPIQLEKEKARLELYMLHWLESQYFTIDENNPKMENFIENLKVTGCLTNLQADFNFESWKTSINGNVCRRTNQKTDNCNLINVQNSLSRKNLKWDDDHEKLCLIINIANFTEGQFKGKPRIGSQKDSENLKDTFDGCGFIVEIFNDLTEEEMMFLLNDLNESEDNNYGCIFMCILSHGCQGGVLCSDNKVVPIKTIEEKLCCKNLINVFKCVVLQACQGKKLGLIEKNDESASLVADGPSQSPIYHINFLLFQATIEDFSAWRDEERGTWFIQDICNVIKESAPIEIQEWTKQVTKRVSSRRGKTNLENLKVLQLPRVQQSLTTDYIIPAYKRRIQMTP